MQRGMEGAQQDVIDNRGVWRGAGVWLPLSTIDLVGNDKEFEV